MRTFRLEICADLYGISELLPADGIKSEETCYFFKLRCEGCGELREPEVCVQLGETMTVNYMGKQTEVHLYAKCKECGREGIILVDETEKASALKDLHACDGNYAPLMTLKCEGLMPEDFSFAGEWLARTIDGREITIRTLSNGDYAEEETGFSVKNPRAKFEPVFETFSRHPPPFDYQAWWRRFHG